MRMNFCRGTQAVLLAGALSFAGAALANTTGYYITQRIVYHGTCKIKTSQLGTKVDANELTIFIMPNHQAQVYNTVNKKYCLINEKCWLDKYGVDALYGPVQKIRT